MMLAQIESLPADTLKNFLWAGAALLVIAYYAKALFWSDKTPQPFAVAQQPPGNSELHLSVKQLNARVKLIEEWRHDISEKMEENKSDVIAAGDRRANAINEHVEAVRLELDRKISDMPHKIISILRDTGNL